MEEAGGEEIGDGAGAKQGRRVSSSANSLRISEALVAFGKDYIICAIRQVHLRDVFCRFVALGSDQARSQWRSRSKCHVLYFDHMQSLTSGMWLASRSEHRRKSVMRNTFPRLYVSAASNSGVTDKRPKISTPPAIVEPRWVRDALLAL